MMSWRFVTFAALFVTCLLTANIIAAKLISVGGVQATFALAAAGMLGVIAMSSPRMRTAWPAPSTTPVPA